MENGDKFMFGKKNKENEVKYYNYKIVYKIIGVVEEWTTIYVKTEKEFISTKITNTDSLAFKEGFEVLPFWKNSKNPLTNAIGEIYEQYVYFDPAEFRKRLVIKEIEICYF